MLGSKLLPLHGNGTKVVNEVVDSSAALWILHQFRLFAFNLPMLTLLLGFRDSMNCIQF